MVSSYRVWCRRQPSRMPTSRLPRAPESLVVAVFRAVSVAPGNGAGSRRAPRRGDVPLFHAAHRQADRVRRGDRGDPPGDVLGLLPGERWPPPPGCRCGSPGAPPHPGSGWTSRPRAASPRPSPAGRTTPGTGRAVTDPTTIRGSVSSGSTTRTSSAAAGRPGFSRSGSRSTCPNMTGMCAVRENRSRQIRRQHPESSTVCDVPGGQVMAKVTNEILLRASADNECRPECVV